MILSTRTKFWLAVLIQVLILFGLIGSHAYTLATGTPVLLKTAPVDPWDPLRGEYISLNYEISRLSPDKVTMGGTPYRTGQQVWVLLQKGNPYWSAVLVSDRRPLAGADQVAIRGTVEYWPMSVPNDPVARPPMLVPIRYGIEQFYVPQGQGLDLQRQQRQFSVEVMVDSFGRPALHKVFLDSKEIRWN